MRKRSLLAVLLFALSVPSFGAIGKDASGSNQSGTGASTLTVTITVGSGLSNSKLVVGVGYYDASHSVNTMTVSPAAAGGSNLTKIIRENDGTHGAAAEIWYIDSPASGSNTVTINMTAAISSSSVINAVAYSFSGMLPGTAETGSAVGNIQTGTNSGNSKSVTTVANNAWIVNFVVSNGGTGTETANGSQANAVTQTTASNGCIIGSTLGPVSPAGATSVGATYPSSGNASSMAAASFAPAPGSSFPIVAMLAPERFAENQPADDRNRNQ